MNSSASRGVLIIAAAATVAAGNVPEPPAELAEGVREIVGDSWGVSAESVELEWGYLPAAVRQGGAPRRVLGSNPSGWLAVLVEGAEGKTVSCRIRAGVLDSVFVAAHALSPGVSLGEGDLEREERVQWGPPRDLSFEPAPGWEVRRAIAAGQTVDKRSPEPPVVVGAGQPLALEWKQGDVCILISGTAMNEARVGERVRARVPGRGGTVSGIAFAPGRAHLEAKGQR